VCYAPNSAPWGCFKFGRVFIDTCVACDSLSLAPRLLWPFGRGRFQRPQRTLGGAVRPQCGRFETSRLPACDSLSLAPRLGGAVRPQCGRFETSRLPACDSLSLAPQCGRFETSRLPACVMRQAAAICSIFRTTVLYFVRDVKGLKLKIGEGNRICRAASERPVAKATSLYCRAVEQANQAQNPQ
jgi:hypothetical protein